MLFFVTMKIKTWIKPKEGMIPLLMEGYRLQVPDEAPNFSTGASVWQPD